MQPQERLEDHDLPGIIRSLAPRRASGVLTLSHWGIRKSFALSRGELTAYASNDPRDLPCHHHQREQVTDAQWHDLLRGLARRAFVSLFAWESLSCHHDAGSVRAALTLVPPMPLAPLVVAGVASIRDPARVRQWLGAPQTLFRSSGERRVSSVREMGLDPALSSFLADLDRPRRIAELTRRWGLSELETGKMVWTLHALGLVARIGETPFLPLRETVVRQELALA